MDPQAAQDVLYITLLPRAASGNKLTFTALFSPHFATAEAYRSMQSKWEGVATSFNADWSLTLKSLNPLGTTLKCPVQPVRKSFDPNVWARVFHKKLGFQPRNKDPERALYQNAWFLAQDADALHMRHQNYRGLHINRQYLQHRENTTGSPQPSDAAAYALRRYSPLVVYIPAVLSRTSGSVTMSDLLAQRIAALNYKDRPKANFKSPGAVPTNLLYTRIEHAVTLLESGGQRLCAPALYAVYKHCVESALVPDDPHNTRAPNQQLAQYVDAIYKQAQGTVTPQGATLPPDARREDQSEIVTLNAFQQYIEFHLFAHPDKIPCQASGDPTFHQLVGLMHQYPALLRPLGLAVDFEAVDVADRSSGAPYTSLHGPLLASIQPPVATQQLIQQFASGVTSFTQCDGAPSFAASPRAGSRLSSGFLKLDPDFFTLVTSDADGASQKFAQQIHTASTIEYSTSAPDGFHDRDLVRKPNGTFGPGDPNLLNKVPSARTVGLSLYQTDRDDVLAATVARDPDGTEADPFFADDLTLGYRMDVQRNNNGTWLSLHKRDSTYTIKLDNHTTTWKPQDSGTTSVVAADEGFITLAATLSTISPPADQPADPASVQVQVHPALVTWNGWSLSIKNPEGQQNGTDPPISDCGPKPGTVTVNPEYKLSDKGTLPALRFGSAYKVRLRQVDLAGNSVPLEATVPVGFDLQTEGAFARSEPIRGPQVLLEEPINHKQQPGEHVDRLVLRDKGDRSSRLLVPPREPLRLAELHGLRTVARPPSAFGYAALVQQTGAFPKVSELPDYEPSGDNTTEDNDGIFVHLHGTMSPTSRYYPDPMARMVRIDAFWLRPDLQNYERINQKPVYLPFFLDSDVDWTDVYPVRVLLEATDGPPSVEKNWGPIVLKKPEILPGIPWLTVGLPPGETVLLQITCCAAAETDAAAQSPSQVLTAFRLLSSRIGAQSAPSPAKQARVPAPDLFPVLGAFHASQKALEQVRLLTPIAAPIAPAQHGHGGGPLAAADDFTAVGAAVDDSTAYADAVSSMKPADLIAGGVHAVTPPLRLMLVHATSCPLSAPHISKKFTVQRTYNIAPAEITGAVQTHWNSTGKVTIEAKWTDVIDDGKSPHLLTQNTREVPFEMVNSGDNPDQVCTTGVTERELVRTHQFRDTRARTVKYSLSASTRFREYFPESENADAFTNPGESQDLSIPCSAIPPAVSLVYVLPAFGWNQGRDSALQRKQVLRVYLNRPFLISGDAECVGVVLAPPDAKRLSPATSGLVTRWGGDPFDPAAGFDRQFMKLEDFAGTSETLQSGCTLQEGGTVDVLPFPTKFAKDRALWFCDIGVRQQQASSAFVRLALVRWQPYGMLLDAANHVPDCRLSQVVVADFMQIRSDRSVSVHRVDPVNVTIALSGVFLGKNAAFFTKILYTIEQRWHSLGRDLGWRPAQASRPFTPPTNPPASGDGTWTANIKLPRSSNTHKFRLLIEEFETDGLNFNRCTYVHYVEL